MNQLVAAGCEEDGRAVYEHRFLDAGFDSLTTVELRNRLTNVTGQRLSTTLIYDDETPAAVARQLLSGVDTLSGYRAGIPAG